MSKKLLIITPGFPKNENDDTCIPAMQIYLKGLIQTGLFRKIEVISIFYPYTAQEYTWNSIKVNALALPQQNTIVRFITLRRAFNKIKSDDSISNPDVIHSFWLNHCALIGERLSKAWRVPHLCTLIGQDVHYTKLWKWLHRYYNPNLIAVSKFQSGFSKLPVKSIIHWGLESINKTSQSPEKTYDIIGIGALTQLKDYSTFVNVVDQLSHAHPEIKTAIIGDGPMQVQLAKQIDHLGLSKHVKLLGHLPRTETLDLLNQSKILLHTSRFESFGMVIAEALQYGLYVVSRKVGIAGINEKSRVVSSEIEMAKEIESILNKSEEYSSTANFDISETVEKYSEEYRSLMD